MKKPLLFVLFLLFAVNSDWAGPPSPVGPLPNGRQIKWHQREVIFLVSLDLCTFYDEERTYGAYDPSAFNPTAENFCDQWAAVCRGAGFRCIMPIAVHVGGFCLWPSAYTNYDVEAVPWKGGKGDVIGDAAKAAVKHGIEYGIYFNPFHRNQMAGYPYRTPGVVYGQEPGYSDYLNNMLAELTGNYGPFVEMFIDGAGPAAGSMDWARFETTIRAKQPMVCIFGDGPRGQIVDQRWPGNELAFAGEPCWSTINRSSLIAMKNLERGELEGDSFIPAEADVSIREGWFYHPYEYPKSLNCLIDMYYTSVGRNALLCLGLTPDPKGLIPESDVKRLYEFGDFIEYSFKVNYALGAAATATQTRSGQYSAANVIDGNFDTYWAPPDSVTGGVSIELDFGSAKKFDVVMLQEYIELGQRITSYTIEKYHAGRWKKCASSRSIGYKRLIKVAGTTASKLRLTINSTKVSGAVPCIREIGIYKEVKNPGNRVALKTVPANARFWEPAEIIADSMSTVLITAELHNSSESVLTTATNEVTFSLFGNGALIGPTVKNAVNGVATAVLQSAKNPGMAIVQAFSANFSPYAVNILTIAPPK
jgi:alpha-L-fucosidase